MVKRGSKGIPLTRPPSQVTYTTLAMTSAFPGSAYDEEIAFEEAVAVSGGAVQCFTPSALEPRDDRRPGAFHDDGRNARDTTGNDEWSASEESELDLVSAKVVDPNETKRIVERELAEQQRNAAVAKVVTGYWCSK